MDLLSCCQWVQKLAVSGCRAAASDIQSRCHAVFRDDHGAAGARFCIFCLADPDRSDLGDWDGAAKLEPEVSIEATDDPTTMRFKVTPGDGSAERAFMRIRK